MSDHIPSERAWAATAIAELHREAARSADTHLLHMRFAGFPGIDFYFKDEAAHPTGSLKHRLARSLFLYALCNGWLREGGTVVEASSGSTAVSEAYFARLLGLRFVAVMPRHTSPDKIAAIEFYGGRCHLVERGDQVYGESERLARECGGHYMDQFTYAERATDWRSNNNIAESMFSQMAREQHPVPAWVVCTAGTGGTAATIGRFIRYRCHDTRLCVADPENSVFFDAFASGDSSLRISTNSRIEGIGRPRVEKSFLPGIVDGMMKIPDVASLAAIRYLERVLGRRCGGSTGTGFIATLALARRMHEAGERGSIATILCDSGERYGHSYYNDEWMKSHGFEVGAAVEGIAACAERGDSLPWSISSSGQLTT